MSQPLPHHALFLTFSALYLALIVHELGHVLAGIFAGFRIVSCGIGVTRPFAKIRIAGVWFYLGRPVLRGFTLALPRRLGPDRNAMAILYAGGSLANLVAGIVAWVGWRNLADWTSWRPLNDWTFSSVFMDVSLMMGVGNLVPFYSSRVGSASDGLTIVRNLRNTLTYDHAHSITSYEWVFALCKSLNARAGVAYYGRALAVI